MTEPTHDPVTAIDRAEPTRMHPLVQAAMSSGQPLDPQMLREFLAVQREYEAGEAKKAFMRALADLKRDLPPFIAKDETVDYAGSKGRVYYKHASLAGAVHAVQPALTKHGFSLTFEPSTPDGGKVTVVCELTHAGGHSKTAKLTAPPDKSGGKSEVQAVASTMTLLQRYALLAVLGVATKDMKDPTGDGADDAAEPAPDAAEPDADVKLALAGWLQKRGKTREEAEALVGRRVADWTNADVARIREWAAPPAPVAAPAGPPAASAALPAQEADPEGAGRPASPTPWQRAVAMAVDAGIALDELKALTKKATGRATAGAVLEEDLPAIQRAINNVLNESADGIPT